MRLNLHQKQVLITRAEPKASAFANEVRAYNGQAIVTPLIKVSYTPKEVHKKILNDLSTYEWLFFTSANGVKYFFQALEEHDALKCVENCQIAAVGSKTNQALRTYGYEADFMPSVYDAKTMAPEFLKKYQPTKRVLLIRGALSGTILNEAFLKQGIPFVCMEVYNTVTNQEAKSGLEQALKKETIDFLTFTSPSTVDAFMALVPDTIGVLHKKVVCIGTTTEKRAKKHGFLHILVPHIFTVESMMEVMHHDVAQERMD